MKRSRKRITVLVPEKMWATLSEAAEFLGTAVNQFVVQTAHQEAQRVIEHESIIRLSQRDSRKVSSLIQFPPKPGRPLRNAVKAPKGCVRE